MLVEIDVKKLSKEEQVQIVKEILSVNSVLRQELETVVPANDSDLSDRYIEKLILQDFKRFDSVFRRLA